MIAMLHLTNQNSNPSVTHNPNITRSVLKPKSNGYLCGSCATFPSNCVKTRMSFR